ncbi:hypothetical protein GCM10027093_08640 [Paraburkholderia jirisanensis]
MLRKILAFGPLLSDGVTRLIAIVLIVLYIAIYAKASLFLPDFVFRDSDKIQSQIGGSNTYQDTSFDAVAKFYAALGDLGTSLFVIFVGATFIWLMVRSSKRVGPLLLNNVLIAPCVFFNLFVASKDTLVVLMSVTLVLLARIATVRAVTLAAIILYVGYAGLVRIYFVLIVAAAFFIWFFRTVPLRGKTIIALTVIVGLYMLPDAAYTALLHPRDMAEDYLISGSPYGARTGFYNPFDPVSFLAFCGDYVYAILKLNVPVMFFPGPKEIAMQIFLWIMVGAVLSRKRHAEPSFLNGSMDFLLCLVFGHMAISMLFEPDLGSYTRHLSSVSLLCAYALSRLTPSSPRRGAALLTRNSATSSNEAIAEARTTGEG